MNAVAPGPPPRWAKLTPQTWPQNENRVPSAAGLPMPPIAPANALRSRRESFTMSGTFNIAIGNAAGQVFPLYLPTDADGDFWCDQIYLVQWSAGAGAINTRGPPALISITDARTARSLTWPGAIPTSFLSNIFLSSDDAGFDPTSYALPSGFRPTTTLPQPFCFTRAGGIQLALTMIPILTGANNLVLDIAFGGWKEYEAASA